MRNNKKIRVIKKNNGLNRIKKLKKLILEKIYKEREKQIEILTDYLEIIENEINKLSKGDEKK